MIPGGALISVVGLYLGVGLNFLLTIVAARQLGTAQFGSVALGLATINLLAVASQAGLSQSSSRFIGEYLGSDNFAALRGFIATVQWVPPLFGFAIAVAGILILQALHLDGDIESVLIVSLAGVPALGSLLLSQNIARGFGRMVLATMPVPVLLPAAALLSFLAGSRAPANAGDFMTWYAAIAASLAVLAILILNFQRVTAWPPETGRSLDIRRWWRVSWPMFITALGQQFLRRADVLILAAVVAPHTLGLYALGARFSQVVAVARYAVNRYSMPQIAREFAKGDLAAVEAGARHAARLVIAATAFVVAGLLLAGDMVLRFAGDAEGAAFGYMLVLLAGQTAAAFRSASLQTLQMCGHERTANSIVLISSPILAIGGAIASYTYGAMGMAGTVAALTAWQYWYAASQVRNRIGVSTAVFGNYAPAQRDTRIESDQDERKE